MYIYEEDDFLQEYVYYDYDMNELITVSLFSLTFFELKNSILLGPL